MAINDSIYYTNISFYRVVLEGVYFIFCDSFSMTHGVVGLGKNWAVFRIHCPFLCPHLHSYNLTHERNKTTFGISKTCFCRFHHKLSFDNFDHKVPFRGAPVISSRPFSHDFAIKLLKYDTSCGVRSTTCTVLDGFFPYLAQMITSMRGCVACNDLWPWSISSRSFSHDFAIKLLKYGTSCAVRSTTCSRKILSIFGTNDN